MSVLRDGTYVTVLDVSRNRLLAKRVKGDDAATTYAICGVAGAGSNTSK